MNNYKIILYSILVLSLNGCATPIKELYPPHNIQNTKNIYIVNHGWHTGIVLKISDITGDFIPEKEDFDTAKFLEIGWGDRGFYQAPKITIPLALQAIFLPTKSVMHVVGFSDPISVEFPQSEIIKLQISSDGFQNIVSQIHNSFKRKNNKKVISTMSGLYGDSRFYPAKGYYHLLQTCNKWTAKIIRSSGFPITPFYATTADNVIRQIYKKGDVIRMYEQKPILDQ